MKEVTTNEWNHVVCIYIRSHCRGNRDNFCYSFKIMTATILYIIIGVVMTCAGIAAYIAYRKGWLK